MTTLTWEQTLLSLAKEARAPAAAPHAKLAADDPLLARAYDHCAALTAIHSRSFYLATRLLPDVLNKDR